MSLVARLLLLLAFGTAPIVAAQVFTQWELWREREDAERASVARYARLVSSDAARIVEGAKGILIAVSEAPLIRGENRSLCWQYLNNLVTRYPQILNITLIDDAGTPVCANTPVAPNATAIDRFYFREALRTDDFAVGDYIVGRTIPKPQLPVALPFRNDAGRRFVIALGLNLTWLQQHFADMALPPGASVWIADRHGTVVVAPSAPDLVGKPLPAGFEAAGGTIEQTFSRRDAEGTSHLVSFQPTNAPPVGLIVLVDLSQKDLRSAARTSTERDLGILLIAIMATIALASIGAKHVVSRPLRQLTSAARQWSSGNYHVRADLPDRTSEVGQLGIAFDHMADAIQRNQQALQLANETLEQRVADRTRELSEANQQLEAEMAERQAAEEALRQSQKMDAIGRLTGGIAHDFNNLLVAIGGSIDFLAKSVPSHSERTLRYADMGREAVERASRMTHRLLAFARQQPLELQVVDINRLVGGMSDLLRRTLGETVEVETVLAGGLWMTRTDPVQLENSLLNLAINARDAMPQGGKLTIETANTSLDAAYAAAHEEVEPGQYVMLAVSDTGTGMTSDTIAHAFEPFFTTKEAGKGTGLGLSMIYGFAKQSRGHVKIYSELGRGTTIKLYLPRLQTSEESTEPARIAASTRPLGQGETVLVVEDDEAVRELTIAFVEDLGYTVLAARDAATALDLVRQHPDIAVLFSDVVLAGGMDGRALAEAACRERPGLKVLFTTGYTPNSIIHGGILDPGVHLLTKPFNIESLGAALQSILSQRQS